VTEFIVFVASVIAVSILGFLAINSTRDNDERVYRNYIALGCILLVDVLIVGIGLYFYIN